MTLFPVHARLQKKNNKKTHTLLMLPRTILTHLFRDGVCCPARSQSRLPPQPWVPHRARSTVEVPAAQPPAEPEGLRAASPRGAQRVPLLQQTLLQRRCRRRPRSSRSGRPAARQAPAPPRDRPGLHRRAGVAAVVVVVVEAAAAAGKGPAKEGGRREGVVVVVVPRLRRVRPGRRQGLGVSAA